MMYQSYSLGTVFSIRHVLNRLRMKACINGYSVRFYTAASLATELVEASDYKRELILP